MAEDRHESADGREWTHCCHRCGVRMAVRMGIPVYDRPVDFNFESDDCDRQLVLSVMTT